MDALLIILGAALAFAGSLYGQRREATHEHARWLRDRRFETWTHVVVEGHRMIELLAIDPVEADTGRRVMDLANAASAAMMLGPATVREAASNLIQAAIDFANALDEDRVEDERQDAFERAFQAFIVLAQVEMDVPAHRNQPTS